MVVVGLTAFFQPFQATAAGEVVSSAFGFTWCEARKI